MNDASPTSAATTETGPALDEFLGAPQARPWYKRPLFIVVGVVAVLLLLLLSRCFTASAEAGYATQTVQRGDLTVTVSATGNLQPTNEVTVGSEQSGIITEVYVDNNDKVTKGQPLALLDPSRLRDAVVQAQANLAAAQAQVAQARATQAQSNANLARLEEVYRLSGGKVPAKTEMDTGRADAQRGVAGVRAAEAQVAQSQAALSTAQVNLSKATIYSPVTGVVLSRQIDPGQTVAASFQAPVLFSIAEDLSKMKLEVKVDEADVGEVREGQRATFTVDAYPGRTFPARITRVDVGANASGSTASGSSSSTSASSATGNVVAYTAELSVENPQLLLRPGMTATAEIVTTEKQGALLVPNAALRYTPDRDGASTQGGGLTSVLVPRNPRRGNRADRQATIGRGSQRTVYILGGDGKPSAVRITVGESNGSETEVLSGDLKPGMEVITGRLAAGQVQAPKQGTKTGADDSAGSPPTMKAPVSPAQPKDPGPPETAPASATMPPPTAKGSSSGQGRQGAGAASDGR